ncbi:hypothetical protein HJD18_01500 [Thermoleophilia bacterium SCSIO 60948]|nr:hypothetical protein HJD18_01500 [Thermoleophilia bacterium SCSIO 60948]
MKKSIAAILATIFAIGAIAAIPSQATAAGIDQIAKQECKQDRREEPREFQRQYGTGKAAIKECARRDKREARRECKSDRRTEPAEFQREYGSGSGAINRCIKDELR